MLVPLLAAPPTSTSTSRGAVRSPLGTGRSRAAGRTSSADPRGEQITWAMTLGGELGFRWWLRRSALDSF
jgi:hypothetical protein